MPTPTTSGAAIRGARSLSPADVDVHEGTVARFRWFGQSQRHEVFLVPFGSSRSGTTFRSRMTLCRGRPRHRQPDPDPNAHQPRTHRHWPHRPGAPPRRRQPQCRRSGRRPKPHSALLIVCAPYRHGERPHRSRPPSSSTTWSTTHYAGPGRVHPTDHHRNGHRACCRHRPRRQRRRLPDHFRCAGGAHRIHNPHRLTDSQTRPVRNCSLGQLGGPDRPEPGDRWRQPAHAVAGRPPADLAARERRHLRSGFR